MNWNLKKTNRNSTSVEAIIIVGSNVILSYLFQKHRKINSLLTRVKPTILSFIWILFSILIQLCHIKVIFVFLPSIPFLGRFITTRLERGKDTT